MTRLSRTTPPATTGIVHFGPGAFFRAFNAVYTDDAMRADPGDWGITAVSLRSPTARDQLMPQGGAFTSVTLSPDGRTPQVIQSITDVLVAPDNPQAVLDRLVAPATRIVSLTITEKGYCHTPATGRLNLQHPDITHDLANPHAPRTAIGFLVTALDQRRREGLPPFTVLSCDNLPANGRVIRKVTLDFASKLSADLADWIADKVAFPATMVDRITPATTPADIAQLETQTGVRDPACVVHEPFRQWVIEDHFPQGRPKWEAAGAQFVRDVAAHEAMKLRCLNGTHSLMAYLGLLAGYDTIAEVANDPRFAQLCQHAWHNDIIPTLTPPDGTDLGVYCAQLLTRYQNPAIQHKTSQIANDGSQKLPQRLLAPIQETLANGKVPRALCLGVAAWIHHLNRRTDQGVAFDINDPIAPRLLAIADQAPDSDTLVTQVLSLAEVFPPQLAANETFATCVAAYCQTLATQGSKSVVQSFMA